MLALSEQYWYVIPAAIGVITLSVYLFLFLSDSSTVPEDQLANLRLLWSLLRSAARPQIHKFSEHLHTIVLPEGLNLTWPFGLDVGSLLFVRPSQQPILDIIIERFKKEGLPGRQRFCVPGFIVKGTPGIGKTSFLNLLLYYAAQLNTDVIIHNAISATIFILRKDGTVDYHELKNSIPKKVRKLLASPSTLYLFNPDERDSQAIQSSAFTVIATSPDEKHYLEFKKSQGMDVYFLAPWTLDEALDANRALPLDRQLEESTLRKRFENVGGSIRLLLSRENMYITTDTKISGLLNDISLDDLVKLHTLIQNEQSVGGLKADKAPHYLFHCQPNKKNGGITCILRFAAKKTETLIVNQIKIKSNAEWEKFVKLMLQVDPSRSSLGLRFENYIHAYMRNYKDLSIKLRVLNNHNFKLNSVLEKTPEFVQTAAPEEAVADALANSKCTYVVPSDPQYPAIDSFYVDGTTVYCFQVTINEKHDFNETRYTEKTQLIEQEYKKATEAKEDAQVKALTFKYCWVVDPKDTKFLTSQYGRRGKSAITCSALIAC